VNIYFGLLKLALPKFNFMRGFCFIFLIYSNYIFSQLEEIINKAEYPFLLNLPNDSVLQANPPVLIFLHGRSLSGVNLDLVKKYGVIREIEKGRIIPAIVIAPQVQKGESWEPKKILSVLEFVQKKFSSDKNRVYVVGMSLGGYGTLGFAGAFPEIVTAAVALCGGGNTEEACKLSTIPLWIQHGDKDFVVPISESEKMVAAIKNCNGGENLKYTIVPGANHGDLERIFRSDEIYDWLFQFTKK
jgi:predicted peptidase